ncbi:DUF6332 family protein [Streptomyces sp. NPDC102402]|uniref:DUF6332 family protein n=1 Tax=Streptomyces sp. NPDC102402 TaxID=3366169 RepID=UPI0038060E4D
MPRRTQAERDAMTVETGYALVTGALVGAAAFAGVCLPALLLDLPAPAERLLFRAGTVLGALVFAVRVVHVLWRLPRRAEERPLSGQPGRPGRTGSDS